MRSPRVISSNCASIWERRFAGSASPCVRGQCSPLRHWPYSMKYDRHPGACRSGPVEDPFADGSSQKFQETHHKIRWVDQDSATASAARSDMVTTGATSSRVNRCLAPSRSDLFGELPASAFRVRGAFGPATDSGVRDVRDPTGMRFAVFPTAIGAQGIVNVPVVCTGAVVN